MNLDTEMGNMENAPIQFLSEKMETLQVPDNTMECSFLRDGKLYFHEPKLRAESHLAVAEKLMYYRTHRAKLEAAGNLTQQSVEIPAEFLDLIAALVQDSEEPFTILSTRIDDLLSPFLRDEGVANKFEQAIEKAIKKVAHKVNYGLTEEVYAKIENTPPKIPWHLHIGKWEVKNIQLLPQDMQQVINIRRQNRQNMTDIFTAFIQSLPATEQATIVNTRQRRNPGTHKEFEESRHKQQPEIEEEKRKKKEDEKKKPDDENKLNEKKTAEDEKRKQREEEKKKREGDKKKKEQSQLRLTSLFAKTSIVETAPYVEKLLEPTNPTLFPAFYIKDNVTMTNKNHCALSSKTTNDNAYTRFRNSIDKSKSVPKSTATKNFLSELPLGSKQRRGVTTHLDIRTLLLPGSADILRVPNVRQILRMKLLQFHENVRPAYYGTFTQKSHRVSGRRPFSQDDNLDYDIDSEAEWEPEGEGEDIVSGDEDEEDPNTDMIDPEDAGWLVPEGYLSDNEGVEGEDEDDRITVKASIFANPSKRIAVRKIVLGPFFEGEGDDILKPFETNFFFDVSEEGYNPFYKEPATRAPPAAPSTLPPVIISSTTQVKTTDFTDERTNALINVINEKSLDSIPGLITEAKTNSLLKDVSKRQLEAKIKIIAIKEKRGSDTRPIWYLKAPLPQGDI